MQKIIFLIIACLFLVDTSSGQRKLIVHSNVPEARVVIDGKDVGNVASSPIAIGTGDVSVSVVFPATRLWTIDPIHHNIDAGQSDVNLDARFSHHYQIDSIPSGAEVILNGQSLGRSPLLVQRKDPVFARFELRLSGYESGFFQPDSSIWNRGQIHLMPVVGLSAESHKMTIKRRRWITVAAAGTSLVAGIAAIQLRAKADRKFDRYNETGNNRLKQEIKRLDIQSGISLGVMQVGLGVVAFRIAF